MINEICKLHAKLHSNEEILCKLSRCETETTIKKEDTIMKVNDHILRIVRPTGEVRLLNVDYIVICYKSEVRSW